MVCSARTQDVTWCAQLGLRMLHGVLSLDSECYMVCSAWTQDVTLCYMCVLMMRLLTMHGMIYVQEDVNQWSPQILLSFTSLSDDEIMYACKKVT